MARNGKSRNSNGSRGNGSGLHYSSVAQSEVPRSRKGKHHKLVSDILGDVERVALGQAIKIPRGQLRASVPEVRSALSRASKQNGFDLATAADDTSLYVWRKAAPKA